LHEGFASLHLIFFSLHRIQALPLTGLGGDVGSLTWPFFLAADGDAGSLPFLLFFVDDLRRDSGDAEAAFFLRSFFAEVFGASGEVDISRSGSL